jgi:hypothetical protein
MKIFKYILLLVIAVTPALSFVQAEVNPLADPAPAENPLADPAPVVDTPGLKNPLKGGIDTVPELLNLIIKTLIIPIGGVVVVFMIIYTGFLFVMAQGNEAKLTKAKSTLVNTVIGAAIILGAYAISVIIQSVLIEITDVIN